MKKGEKLLFHRMFLIVIMIFFINSAWFLYKYGGMESSGLSGLSVKTVERTFVNLGNMPKISQIFLMVQWGLIFIVLFYTVAKDRMTLNKRKEVSSVNLKKKSMKNKTDLDALYEILKKNKKLRISSIAKAFNVNDDTASEWCKILESGNLAEIDYPGFGAPVVKIKEKENENKEVESKENVKGKKKSFLKKMFSKKEKSSENKKLKNGKKDDKSEEKVKELKNDKKVSGKKDKKKKKSKKNSKK